MLGGGTYHKPPPLNQNGFVLHESTICVRYLVEKGIPPDKLIREWFSYDTIANCYFAFQNFILPRNSQEIGVITSEFHMNRVKVIYDWLSKIYQRPLKINFITVADVGLSEEILASRRKREKGKRRGD